MCYGGYCAPSNNRAPPEETEIEGEQVRFAPNEHIVHVCIIK